MSALILKLFGSPQISLDEQPINHLLVSRKAQALLIYTAVTGKLCSREMLAELFWQNMPLSQAIKNLRTILPNLRQVVGSHLTITRHTIQFNRECSYRLDVEAVQAISNCLKTKMNPWSLGEAVTQYQGDFLEGFYLSDAPEFENWVLVERERLRELAIEGLHILAQQHLIDQDYTSGLAITRKLLMLDPWRETAHQQLMLFLAQSGQRRAALAQYEACRQILADEFNDEPMPETTALYERIRNGEVCELDITPQTLRNYSSMKTVVIEPLNSQDTILEPLQTALLPVTDSPQLKSSKFPTGPIPLYSPLYIDRPPIEQTAGVQIQQPGGLVRIKAPRQMGKTSLILRILADAIAQGYATVRLNINQADTVVLANPEKFLRWFCTAVAEKLERSNKLSDYWDAELGSKVSCTNYFRRYLLPQLQTPLVLVLDELDQLFEHLETAQTFLPLLRFWHEEASDSSLWQNLRLVVAHSTEIYVPLNLNQSPFNVGLPIKLREFNRAEMLALGQCYGLDELFADYSQSLTQLFDLVGGHPYLLNMAFHSLSQGNTPAQVLETATNPSGIYASHLRQHLTTLQSQPDLTAALKSIVMSDHPVATPPLLAYQLESMGLTKMTSEGSIPICTLYRQYFRDYLSDPAATDMPELSSQDSSLHAIA